MSDFDHDAEARCLAAVAFDLMPLVLELRAAMSVSHPSPTTLARAFVDAYPRIETYGVFLACSWACTPTPIGA